MFAILFNYFQNIQMKDKLKKLFFLILVLILSGCTKPPIYKADTILGYWKGERTIEISIDGDPPSVFTKTLYARFLDTNCGYLYDFHEEWTNNIKWALQERENTDVLIVTTILNSNGQSSDLSINTVNNLEEFEEMSFTTISTQVDTISDGIKTTKTTTLYEKR